jgi:hypothetical protein
VLQASILSEKEIIVTSREIVIRFALCGLFGHAEKLMLPIHQTQALTPSCLKKKG